MTRTRLLIRGGYAITMDAAVGDVPAADVLIEGDRIAYVGPRRDDLDGTAELVDASDRIVLPGLVDGHRHTWEVLLRGVSADWTLGHYYEGLRRILALHYRAEDLYIANLLGIVDGLDAGVTTTLDWCHNINSPEHADAAVAALRDSGARVVFGYGNSNDEWCPVSDVPHSDDARRIQEQYFSADGLVTMHMAIRGPQYATLDVTKLDMALSRELGLRMSMSVGDGEWGRNGPVRQLYAEGLMGEDVGYVHCTSLADDELQLIADTGGTTVISPDLEAQMWGAPATGRLLRVGLEPSLSVDCTTSISGDLFGVMRTAVAVERAVAHDAATARGEVLEELPLSARDVLGLATTAGARFCGLADEIGSLTAGKQADVVLVACDSLAMTPVNNPVGAAVLIAQRSDVDAVIVAGQFVKRDGCGNGILGLLARLGRASTHERRTWCSTSGRVEPA